jgi:hypothetical protein
MPEPAIETQRLEKTFPNGVQAIADLDLRVEHGSAPLQRGVDGWGVLVVVVGAFAALVAGALLVDRRDIETP